MAGEGRLSFQTPVGLTTWVSHHVPASNWSPCKIEAEQLLSLNIAESLYLTGIWLYLPLRCFLCVISPVTFCSLPSCHRFVSCPENTAPPPRIISRTKTCLFWGSQRSPTWQRSRLPQRRMPHLSFSWVAHGWSIAALPRRISCAGCFRSDSGPRVR